MSEEIMLTEKQQAEALHQQILTFGEMVAKSLWGMCVSIKQMRDSKLYKALGFKTFEAYTEEKLGMKHAQVYKYISIADGLNEDFVHSSGQIGVQKLFLLSKVTEEQREQITETVNIESTTVKALQEQIAALQAAKETAEADAAQAKNAAHEAEEAKERNRRTLLDLMQKKTERVKELEAQVKELESKPQDVAVAVVDHTEEVEALQAEIELLRTQLAEKPDTQLALGVEPIYRTDTKALFKPYLTTAADALNRLAEFIGQHQADANYSFFIEKMQATFDFTNQKIQAMKG